MTVPDDSYLLHRRPDYDPAKAREYYLRTRQLKGRGATTTLPTGRVGGGRAPTPIVVKPAVKVVSKHVAPKKSPEQVHAEVKVRMTLLNKRLDRLKDVLSKLVTAAKARSGVEDKTKSPAEKQKEAKGSSPQTAKEKRQAHQDYLKNKKDDPKGAQAVQQEIADVQKKIEKARQDLRDALAKSKEKNAQAHPQTASKGR